MLINEDWERELFRRERKISLSCENNEKLKGQQLVIVNTK